MTRTNPRLALLLTIALGIGAAAVFVAGSAGGQSEGVPVDFAPSDLDRVDLYFWRTNGSSGTNCNVFSEAGGDLEAPDTAGVCQLQIQQPSGATATTETRAVQHSDESQWDENPGVRFALDVSPGSDAPDGAAYPFTVDAHPSALSTEFDFSSDRVCSETVPGGDALPVDFHVRHYKVDEADLDGPPQTGIFESAFASGTETGCHSSGTEEITVTAGPGEPVTFQQDEVLVTEIVAAAPEGDSNTTWTIHFESDDAPSHVTVRTDQVVEQAVWATDRTGTPKDTFDPNAPDSERFLVPHAAIRSPFGHDAVPAEDNEVGIEDPDGAFVDLITDDDGTTTSLDLVEIEDLRKRSGALKVFEIEEPEDQAQPWNYDEVKNGPHTIVVDSEIAGAGTTFERTVAMGAFDFSLAPFDAESTTHLLQDDSTTTFLLNLSNTGSDVDSYEVNADFTLSQGGDAWSVDLIGVDQNNRVTVEPSENTLLRVKVSPPEDVTVGDRGRVDVTATSSNSGAENNLTLEAQVTDSTVRDVGALFVADQPAEVGIDETTRLRAFAWNQGTAPDGMSISLVPNSTESEKPDSFEVEVAQGEVTGVSPGNVASVPIDVTTEPGVSEGDQLTFRISVQSRSDTSVRSELELETVVTADRGLQVVGLDHQNDEALESLRYSRFNRSQEDVNGDQVVGVCEPAVRGPPQQPEECADFQNWTYHRAVVTNVGDQRETVNLSILPAGDLPGRTTAVPSDDCTPILEDRVERMGDEQDVTPVTVVGSIDHGDPGGEPTVPDLTLEPDESEIVYLRLGYDGFTPYNEDVTPDQACSQETYHATLLASLDDGQDQSLSTETVFPFDNTQDMPEEAQARLALTDDFVREDGSYAKLPLRTGLELGETTTINFTLSMQQGHEDRTRVEVISDTLVETLESEGWNITLVSIGPDAEVVDDHEIVVPSEDVFEDDRSIGHASGVDYKLGLEVRPPPSGPQESERHSFSIQASSEEEPTEQDTVTLDTQIGRTFDFDADPGEETLRAHPGDEVAFGLTVLNEGATRDGYNIDVNSTSSAVDVSAEPDDPRISSGSQQTSSIRVDVSDGAAENNEVTITATVTAERGTPNDRSDDLGPRTFEYTVDVRPPSTLEMEAQRSVVSVSPGGENAIDFSITNQKDTPQNLVVSQVVGPPGWDTSLSDNDEERRIAGGETITQTVLVEAPESIVEGSTFPFVVQAENVSATNEFAVAKAEAIAQGQTALTLEVERNRTQVVDRGDTTQFPVLVRNPGTSPTSYKLSTSFESDDWLSRFLEADSGNVLSNQTVRVPENEFRRVLVEVQAPNEVDRGHVEDITVSGFAEGQRDVTDEVSLEAAVHDFGVDIEVTGAQAMDVAPGDNAAFQVAITNTGNGEDEISLSFASPDGDSPTYPVTSALTDDTTPTLEPGETLENVTVEVQVPSPSPDSSPVATEDGVTTVVEARSGADLASGTVPTATAEITTHLVDFVINDVDGDGAFEVALDLNRDLDDGYEVFRDQDVQMIERGELNSSQSVGSEGLYVVDADEDDRAEHLIDTDNDGVGDVYFDPDRARTYEIPYTVDVTGDAQAEHPIDADFDGVIDGVFDPADEVVRKTAHVDLSGDGRRDLLVDTNGDTRYDRFVDPHQDPALVTDVERDGDLYKVDTDGSGQIDTHYDVQTQSVQDAETANLESFLGSYWYVLVVFLAVVVAFGAIFYRRL